MFLLNFSSSSFFKQTMSRLFSSLKSNSGVIFRRFAAFKSFSSSLYTSSATSNVLRHQLTEQNILWNPKSLNHSKKFGSSKIYYSSSTNNTKRTLPLPEQDVTSISWRSFLIPVSVLAGFAGFVYFIHSNDEKRVVLKGKGEKYERSAIQGPIIGGPFSLVNTEGQLMTEKNLVGNWVLLYFGYTSSPDVGPAELQKMAKSIDILESKQNLKVLPIFVTIDPQRDTPAQLRAYIREFDTRIVGLTGPVGAVRQMAREYRVFFRKVEDQGDDYLIDSSHNMYLINPNMEVTRSFGVEYGADELAEAIAKEVKKK